MLDQQDRRSLSDTLRAVAAEEANLAPSADVEVRLRAEVRAIAWRRRAAWLAVASLAAAATLAIAVAVPGWRAAVDRGDAQPAPSRAEGSNREVATAFFPLDYSGMPVSNGQLVRLEVPRAALASFGLAPNDVPNGGSPGTAGGTVQADVLVGEDGVARAVRFIGRVGADDRRPVEEKKP